uniref:Dynein associated protein domain-containing protein n=1 Tax=Plectus sambesii TaxID=2011161 RepID=A0A914VYN7_9BILA
MNTVDRDPYRRRSMVLLSPAITPSAATNDDGAEEEQGKKNNPSSRIPTSRPSNPQRKSMILPPLSQSNPRILKKRLSEEPNLNATPRSVASSRSSLAFVRERDETPSSLPRSVPEEMSEGAELEWLRAEHKDLSEKLETLRLKRAEDKTKLVDYERCKIQLQQLLEYKSKMTDAHAEVQRQLQEARKEAKEAIEAREQHHEEMSGFSEQLEMATLDREMAEEKAELLQQELDSLKERNIELETDLEILKSEMAEPGTVKEGNSVQMKQLEQQNERLKEALVKMRDLSGASSTDAQRLSKENEELRTQIAEVAKRHDKMQQQVQLAEMQMNDLKEQVDAALGSEEMVEKLSSDNLMLEQRASELEDAIADLEQMRMMDEEMLESQRDVERDLRQELDLAAGKINEVHLQMKACAAQAQDYENTILKFRQKTSDLQEEIQDLKDQVLRAEAKARGSDDDEVTDRSSFAVFTAGKNFAETVDNEVRVVDLEHARQHAKYLKAFLPDNFGKPGGDNDAVLLSLLFPRLSSKASVLAKLLSDKNPPVPGGMRREHVTKSHKAEQWGHCAKFIYHLNALGAIVRKFETAVSRCSVERLARLAQLQPEMAAQERIIDQYLELIKTNRLDENTSFDNLVRVINYFQNIYSVHLHGDDYNANQFMSDSITQLLSGLRWFRTNCERISFFLLPGASECNLGKLVKDLSLFITESEQFCLRAKNRIPTDKDLNLNQETIEQLAEAVGSLEKAANVLHQACTVASTQVSMLPDVEGLEPKRLEELLHEGAEKVHGKMKDKTAEDAIKLSLGMLMSQVAKLADTLDKGALEVDRPETRPFPPLLDRAHARKQDAVEAEGLRWQLEKKENEIMELKKQLRIKSEDISEAKVRLEMAEKRLQSTGKEGDERVVRLQRKVDDLMSDLKKKEAEYEQTMDALQQELIGAEKEKTELKDKLKSFSKKALLANISSRDLASPSVFAPPSPGFGAVSAVHDSPLLLNQIESLKQALRYSESERRRLAGQQMQKKMTELRPLVVPNKPNGPAGLTDLDKMTNMRHDDLCQLMKESNKLTQEYVEQVRTLRLPDLTKKTEKTSPLAHLTQLTARQNRIDSWHKDLLARLIKFRAGQLYGASAPTDFAQFPTTAFAHQRSSQDRPIFARIQMLPVDKNDAGKTYTVPVDGTEWCRIQRQLVA